MDWSQAKDWILMSIGGGIMIYARQLVLEIQSLNIKVAVLIEKQTTHEDRIKRLEDRF